MSIKKTVPKKGSPDSQIEGRLQKLIKQYEGTDIASRIEANLQTLKLVSFPRTTPSLDLFNSEYYHYRSNLNQDKDEQVFPIYLFESTDGPRVFSGWNEYIKVLNSPKKEFQGYLIKHISEPEVILFFLEEMKRDASNLLLLAYAYRVLKEKYAVSYQALSDIIKVSKSQIINIVHLLNLPPLIISAIKNQQLTYALARPLNGLKNVDQKVALFKRIIATNLSAHQVEELVKEYKYPEQINLNRIYLDQNKIIIKCKNQSEAQKISAALKKSNLLD